MAKSPRNQSPAQMLVAMALLLVPIMLVTWAFTRNPEPPVNVVDFAPLARTAQDEADYEVLVPSGLPEGWVCTRARWTPDGAPGLDGEPVPGDTWQAGFLTPGRMYLGIDQRDSAPEAFVADVTRQGRPEGVSVVGASTWERYVSDDGRTRSLVLRGDAVTIVSGDLAYEALEAFAATLVPVG